MIRSVTRGRLLRPQRLLHVGPQGPASVPGASIVSTAPAAAPDSPQHARFKVLGTGGLLQVHLPASVQLFARRNSLVGYLGGGPGAVVARSSVASSLLARLIGRQPVLYQRVLATEPIVCLVSSGSDSAVLTALDLNGTIDWVVKSPAELQAYTGQSLVVQPRTAWAFGSSAPPFAHLLLSGRGQVALKSPGPLFEVQLAEGERVLVQRSSLAAYSVDTNSAHPAPKTADVGYSFSLAPSPETLAQITLTHPSAQKWWERLVAINRSLRSLLQKFFRRGSSRSYIELYGPSTVLVTAASSQVKLQPYKTPDDATVAPAEQAGN